MSKYDPFAANGAFKNQSTPSDHYIIGGVTLAITEQPDHTVKVMASHGPMENRNIALHLLHLAADEQTKTTLACDAIIEDDNPGLRLTYKEKRDSFVHLVGLAASTLASEIHTSDELHARTGLTPPAAKTPAPSSGKWTNEIEQQRIVRPEAAVSDSVQSF